MSVRVAIVGAGKMGHIHADAYREIPGVELVFIVEKDPAKGQDFAQRYGCEMVETIEQIPAGQVEAVDICLPTWLHRQAIVDAVSICGKGVFCEKPICLFRDEYTAICQAARQSGRFVMVGQVLRFWNGYTKIRELVQEGAIGAPRFITCLRRQKMPEWSMGNWLMDGRRSGGILMDLNIHDADYVFWLLGLPETVSGEIVSSGGKTLHSLITLGYPECCASIVGSWGMPAAFCGGELGFSLEIVGDSGMLTYQGGDEICMITDSCSRTIQLPRENAYKRELEYFVDCIRHNKQPERSSVQSVYGTMEILWAAKYAAANGEIVTFRDRQAECCGKEGGLIC